MKETPVLFNTEMVKAYQQGRKTQTRRLKGLGKINENPDAWHYIGNTKDLEIWHPSDAKFPNQPWFEWREGGPGGTSFICQCPFGQAGDRLWVRETWRGIEQEYGPDRIEFKASEKWNLTDPWKPSIHMPKSACRFFPEILSTRPVRLQDISENDAKAEGVERIFLACAQMLSSYLWKNYNSPKDPSTIVQELSNPVSSFESLWRSIHGNESWAMNPWVWRIEFKPFQP
jgi:hypothetical protein